MLFDCSIDKNAYCMSINEKRFEYLCHNFEYVGLKAPILYKCVRWKNGSNTGCLLGHIGIIMMAKTLNLPWVTVYEDDAYPRLDVLWMFKKIRHYIPSDCGLLKIGSSSIRRGHTAINKLVFRTSGDKSVSFGSHAYIIRRECYDLFLNSLQDARVPDVAMSWKYFEGFKYKPYGLFMNSMLFIQKNIDTDNIISHKGGQKYWYMDPKTFVGRTSNKPPEGFSDILFQEDEKYVKTLCVVLNDNWKNKKKSAIIENNTIMTKDEKGSLNKIEDNLWEIKWDNIEQLEYLIMDHQDNGTDYYKIIQKLQQKKVANKNKQYKFLLCITSFKRPIECLGQIHRFFNGSYSNFIMSVIVRNVDDNIYNQQMLPEVQKYIDSGKLIITKKENSNMLNNLIQCVEQCDQDWDYFFKIDDDDWYSPNYLETINDNLKNQLRQPVGGHIAMKNITSVYIKDKVATRQNVCMGLCGGSLFGNKKVYEILKEFRDNIGKNIEPIISKYNLSSVKPKSAYSRGRCEDSLLDRIIDSVSKNEKIDTLIIPEENMYSIYRIYDGVLPRPKK